MELKTIATIRTDLPSKFAIPRQSGLVEELQGLIVFEPGFRVEEALRGLEGFSHIWLIWGFSEVPRRDWSPTVRPPRLGGNRRMGVFATRSPFRPNPLGLSCVRLLSVENGALRVAGADLMDGTPIYDIKPYLPLADLKPDATGGFAAEHEGHCLAVDIPAELEKLIPPDKLPGLRGILAQDPRPAYQEDPERIYGFPYAGLEIRFRVENGTAILVEAEPIP